jgi:glycosyltransferase involved in cell wall biosynthesis
MKFSIIVNYFNPKRKELLRRTVGLALACLRQTCDDETEIITADGSGFPCDHLSIHCREAGITYLPAEAPEPFAQTYNRGAQASRGDVVVLCASDIFVTGTWIAEIRAAFDRTGAAMVCPYLGYSDYEAQCYKSVIKMRTFAPCSMTINLNAIRRETWERIGPLDPMFSGNYNDLDYLIRLRRAGLQAVIADCGWITHHGSATLNVSTLLNPSHDIAAFGQKYPEFTYPGLWHKCWHPLFCRSRIFGALMQATARANPKDKRFRRIAQVQRWEPFFNRV